MSSYIDKTVAKENLCMAYIQRADEAREENNYLPSKEEFQYLRQAAQLRSELAKMAVGEARMYQTRKLKELTERINEVVRYLDPEMFEQYQNRRKEARDNAAAKAASGRNSGGNNAAIRNGSGSTAGKSGKSSRDSVSEETVQSWFAPIPKHSFKDVAGMGPLKQRLIDCALSRKLEGLKAYLKMPIVHSYFFYGPPGCGKTFIIRAFAHELMGKDYKYLAVNSARIMSSMVSIAEKNIDRLFDEAIKNAPCILFIDEIDGVCKDRNQPYLPEYAATLTTAFLTAYNKLRETEKPVIFIGATNFPDQVDDAMLDRVELVHVELPDAAARAHAMQMKFEKTVPVEGTNGTQTKVEKIVTLEDGFTYEEMGERTNMYNYRDLDRLEEHMKNLLLKAVSKEYKDERMAIEALKNGTFRMTRSLFEEALAAFHPTPKEDILRTMQEWRQKIDNTRNQ